MEPCPTLICRLPVSSGILHRTSYDDTCHLKLAAVHGVVEDSSRAHRRCRSVQQSLTFYPVENDTSVLLYGPFGRAPDPPGSERRLRGLQDFTPELNNISAALFSSTCLGFFLVRTYLVAITFGALAIVASACTQSIRKESRTANTAMRLDNDKRATDAESKA